jgi:4-amino-4-deoxy-L-arabinose transferase-like glycosyltransferase
VRSLVQWLQAHRGSAKYLVAAFSSQSSASIIIESGDAVITIGGFSGSDPAPTLAQFEQLVAKGEVRYILIESGGGLGAGPGGAGSSSAIASWAEQHGKAVSSTATGASSLGTVYDLSSATT